METTYEVSRQRSEASTAPAISKEGGISRKALITFLCGAAIVFSFAVYYCMTTNHAAVGTILVGAFTVICIFASSVYRAFK